MMMLTKRQPRFASLGIWSPFVELDGFRRLFDEPFVPSLPWNLGENGEGEWRPLVDIVENKDGLLLKVEIPGVKQEDISLSLEDNVLTVKGERKYEAQTNEDGYSRVERRYGAFSRTVLLPPTVDADQVKATYKDGVLEILLPKQEEAKPKTIKVETA
jgi:HSP20 family protein